MSGWKLEEVEKDFCGLPKKDLVTVGLALKKTNKKTNRTSILLLQSESYSTNWRSIYGTLHSFVRRNCYPIKSTYLCRSDAPPQEKLLPVLWEEPMWARRYDNKVYESREFGTTRRVVMVTELAGRLSLHSFYTLKLNIAYVCEINQCIFYLYDYTILFYYIYAKLCKT